MWHFLFLLFCEIVEIGIFISATCFAVFFSIVQLIPNVKDVEQVIRRPYIRVVNNQGDLLASYGDFYSEKVDIDQLPKYVLYALLDTEDRRFFSHIGFDFIGILRALMLNVTAGRITQGGSSITQQLAKNFFISKNMFGTYDQSLQRKIYEIVLALILESTYTKKQILSFYINRVYFGASAFGISAASERFFGKKPTELNVYEAARLIGSIQAPSRYLANKEQGDKRTLVVLSNMLHNGHISEKDQEFALLLESKPEVTSVQPISRYFADWIVQNLPEELVARGEDITVYTTLDPVWQEIAEKHAKNVMDTWGKDWEAESVAFVACDCDGGIKAMIGGLDYSKSKFNMVTSASRQPGSLFKIFVYLAALEKGYTTQTEIYAGPVEIGSWKPRNFNNDKFETSLSLLVAFAKSVNTVTIRLGQAVKPRRIIEMAQRLLITSEMPNDLSLCLGCGEVTMLEMMPTLLTIANQGDLTSAYGVEKVISTNTKEVLYQHPEKELNIVLEGKIVNQILDLMEGCVEFGSGRAARFSNNKYTKTNETESTDSNRMPNIIYPAAGKTGTTQFARDKWFGGFTAHAVACARFSTNKQGLKEWQGKSLHVRLWKDFMEELHAKLNFKPDPLLGAEEENVLNKQKYQDMMQNIMEDKFVEDKNVSERDEHTKNDQSPDDMRLDMSVDSPSEKVLDRPADRHSEKSARQTAEKPEEQVGAKSSGVSAQESDKESVQAPDGESVLVMKTAEDAETIGVQNDAIALKQDIMPQSLEKTIENPDTQRKE